MQGGSYIINEAGERVLVQRTDHTAAPEDAAVTSPAAKPAAPAARKIKPAPAAPASDNQPKE